MIDWPFESVESIYLCVPNARIVYEIEKHLFTEGIESIDLDLCYRRTLEKEMEGGTTTH